MARWTPQHWDPDVLTKVAREIRARARRDQGLPENMEDPVVLDQLAAILDPDYDSLATGCAS